MQIANHFEINKIAPSTSTVIWEYPTDDKDISGAVGQIKGRYPETGYAQNTKFKELVFVISGNGKIITPAKSYPIELGDEILIQHNEKYAWEGNMTLFMATAPKYNPDNHKMIP